MKAKIYPSLLMVTAALMLSGCATTNPPELGLTDGGKLSPCPDKPNCVSSDATESDHRIEPLTLKKDSKGAWQALLDHLKNDPSFTITSQQAEYLRAEARTRLFRFVDDVEFHLRPEKGQIAMRSASRVGYWDFGTNRRRLEAVRQALRDAQVLANGS